MKGIRTRCEWYLASCSLRTGAVLRTAQAFAPNVKLVAVGSRKNLCIHAQLRRIKSSAVRAPLAVPPVQCSQCRWAWLG